MARTRCVSIMALLLVFSTVAHAQTFGGYGNPFYGISPFDTTEPTWINAVAASNLTGVFPMPGRDVTAPWPGTPVDWHLRITAVDVSTEGGGNRLLGYSLDIIAPESLLTPSTNITEAGAPVVNGVDEEQWGFCAWFFSTYNNNPENRTANADGSCEGFIDDACLKAVEEEARESYLYLEEPSYGTRFRCFDLDVPDVCIDGKVGNDSTGAIYRPLGVPLRYLNGSTTFQDGYLLDEADERSPEAVARMWRDVSNSFYPVLTLFAHMAPNGTNYTGQVDPGYARLSCIRPDGTGTENGVQTGGGGGSGTGTADVPSPSETGSTAAGLVRISAWGFGAMFVAGYAAAML